MNAPAGEPLLSRGYRARLLTVLLGVSVFNYTDRILVPVLTEPIKQDLHLSDLQLGLLNGLGFAVIYTMVGIPMAWLADRYNRTRILAFACMIWSALTILSGFTVNFFQLLLARAGVGIGEAGFLPPTASLLSDHFPANRRASAMSIVQLGSPASPVLGAILGAWIASQWGWRAAFIAIGIPSLIIAFSVLFLLREPPRGLVDGIREKPVPPPFRKTLGELLRKRSFRHLMIGGALAMFGLQAVGSFMTSYFVRVHHLSFPEAFTIFGIVQFFAAVIGLLAGGFGSDRLASADIRWRAWVPAASLLLAAPLYFTGFSTGSVAIAVACLLLAGICFFIFFVPTLAMTQNMVAAQSRATAIAVYSLVANLIGQGLGPTLAGLASDRIAGGSFTGAGQYLTACPGGKAPPGSADMLVQACDAAAAGGIRGALLIVSFLYAWAAFHYYMVGRTLAKESLS
jgi:predicted MFS family arabinose efflux permease